MERNTPLLNPSSPSSNPPTPRPPLARTVHWLAAGASLGWWLYAQATYGHVKKGRLPPGDEGSVVRFNRAVSLGSAAALLFLQLVPLGRRALASAPARFVGYISFSLYLLHAGPHGTFDDGRLVFDAPHTHTLVVVVVVVVIGLSALLGSPTHTPTRPPLNPPEVYGTLTSLLFLRLHPVVGYHGAAWAAFAASLPVIVLLAWAMTLLIDDPTVRYTRVAYDTLFGGYDEAHAAHRWARRRLERVVWRWEAFKARGPVEGGWLWWLLCVDDGAAAERKQRVGEDEKDDGYEKKTATVELSIAAAAAPHLVNTGSQ